MFFGKEHNYETWNGTIGWVQIKLAILNLHVIPSLPYQGNYLSLQHLRTTAYLCLGNPITTSLEAEAFKVNYHSPPNKPQTQSVAIRPMVKFYHVLKGQNTL